jgi:hypothetical protein
VEKQVRGVEEERVEVSAEWVRLRRVGERSERAPHRVGERHIEPELLLGPVPGHRLPARWVQERISQMLKLSSEVKPYPQTAEHEEGRSGGRRDGSGEATARHGALILQPARPSSRPGSRP